MRRSSTRLVVLLTPGLLCACTCTADDPPPGDVVFSQALAVGRVRVTVHEEERMLASAGPFLGEEPLGFQQGTALHRVLTHRLELVPRGGGEVELLWSHASANLAAVSARAPSDGLQVCHVALDEQGGHVLYRAAGQLLVQPLRGAGEAKPIVVLTENEALGRFVVGAQLLAVAGRELVLASMADGSLEVWESGRNGFSRRLPAPD